MNTYVDDSLKKKKVCFLIPTMDAGGIENYLVRFLQFDNSKGLDCTIIARNARPGDLTKEYEKTDVNIRYQKVGFVNPVKWYRLYRHFKNQSYDTICDFNGNFGGIPMLIGKLARIPNRITFYRRSSRAYKLTILKILYDNFLNRLVYHYATKILSNSKHALNVFFKDKYESISNSKFKIVPNGIDPESFKTGFSQTEARKRLNIQPGAYVIGHVGRFDPAKNHKMIFKVAALLLNKIANVQFLFCGKGTDSKEFKEATHKYGIRDQCIFLGLQDNIPIVLKTIDLFYFPSVTEGQPNALIEAMIMGLPVLASRIPPICEIIPEELHDDLLVDPKKVSASVKRIMSIYNKTVEPFSLERFMKNEFDANKNLKLFEDEL